MKNSLLVVGASGGIGGALVSALSQAGEHVIAVSRQTIDSPPWGSSVEVHTLAEYSEAQIFSFVNTLNARGVTIKMVIVATGVLHDESNNLHPEKRLEDVSHEALGQYFTVNSIIPALWLKYLVNVLAKEQPSVVALSARVGSIADNQLGGWYGYRASKAALNMLLKTASVEYARRLKQPLLVSYHPGTVDTALSQPFQRNVKANKLFTAEFTARQLLLHLSRLDRTQPCHFIAWDGTPVPW